MDAGKAAEGVQGMSRGKSRLLESIGQFNYN